MTGEGLGRQWLGRIRSTLIYNFDVGGAGLKNVHHKWLQLGVEGVLKRGGSVTIVGLASRTGSTGDNLGLSQERADRTLAYLRARVRNNFNVLKCVGFGEGPAEKIGQRDKFEDARFRSVMLYTWENPNPPPRPATIDLSDIDTRGVAPGIDWGDYIGRGIDVAVGLSGLLELVPAVAEIAGQGGLLFSVISGLAGMPPCGGRSTSTSQTAPCRGFTRPFRTWLTCTGSQS